MWLLLIIYLYFFPLKTGKTKSCQGQEFIILEPVFLPRKFPTWLFGKFLLHWTKVELAAGGYLIEAEINTYTCILTHQCARTHNTNWRIRKWAKSQRKKILCLFLSQIWWDNLGRLPFPLLLCFHSKSFHCYNYKTCTEAVERWGRWSFFPQVSIRVYEPGVKEQSKVQCLYNSHNNIVQ